MPAHIIHIRIFLPEFRNNQVNLIFNLITVNHGIFTVMIMLMAGLVRMMVNKRSLFRIFIVVRNRVHQDSKAAPLSRRNRNCRNSQHLRKTVKIDFHSSFFHHVHHIKCQHNRFPQFDQLQGQIQIAFQTGGIHHIHNYIYLIAHQALSCHLFFHCIRSQTVCTRQVNQLEFLPFISCFSFFFLYRNAGPVGHFQIGSRIGVK